MLLTAMVPVISPLYVQTIRVMHSLAIAGFMCTANNIYLLAFDHAVSGVTCNYVMLLVQLTETSSMLHVQLDEGIPYSRKYWRSLNLAVCPQTVYSRI